MSTTAVAPQVFEVLSDEPVIEAWEDGSVRIAGTRLLLDLVIEPYKAGHRPEEIAEWFGPRPLAPLYGAIAYYHAHTEQVEAYLARRHVQAERNQADYERRFPEHADLGARLKARLEDERAQPNRG